jgi:hypothetical protein
MENTYTDKLLAAFLAQPLPATLTDAEWTAALAELKALRDPPTQTLENPAHQD